MELKKKLWTPIIIIILLALSVYAVEQKVFTNMNFLGNDLYNISNLNTTNITIVDIISDGVNDYTVAELNTTIPDTNESPRVDGLVLSNSSTNSRIDDINSTKGLAGDCGVGFVIQSSNALTSPTCVAVGTSGSGGDNRTYYFNKTTTTYNGSLNFSNFRSYEAADAICDEFSEGTHMCTVQEIFDTIVYKNISNMTSWDMSVSTGYAWIKTGGPKFAPATIPFDDCAGWTDDENTRGGNFLIFNNSDYPLIAAGTCGSPNEKALACCKNW